MYYLIYETTNLTNGKLYRGAHQTKNVNDGYLGSGKLITRAINKYGEENFSRTILCYCKDIDEMIQKEAEYVDEDWVNNKSNYNLQTGGLSYGILNEKSKKKISNSVKQAHKNGAYNNMKKRGPLSEENKAQISKTLKERYQNQEHHLKGKDPWNKGKVGLQVAWNKGKKTGPNSKESNEQRSTTLKERYKTHPHHLKGKDPWNKGKKGSQVAWNKGVPAKKFICPHCGKEIGGASNFKRWHGDNCKLKLNSK